MSIHLGGKGMRRKQKALILLAVLLVAAVVSYRFIRSKGQTDPTAIRVSGNIEVTDVEVSFKIPGRDLPWAVAFAPPASQIGGSQCRFNFSGPQGLEMCNLCLIRLPSRSS